MDSQLQLAIGKQPKEGIYDVGKDPHQRNNLANNLGMKPVPIEGPTARAIPAPTNGRGNGNFNHIRRAEGPAYVPNLYRA